MREILMFGKQMNAWRVKRFLIVSKIRIYLCETSKRIEQERADGEWRGHDWGKRELWEGLGMRQQQHEKNEGWENSSLNSRENRILVFLTLQYSS